eukprot:GILK01009365.1.p1 GENE.GILK01009365.1~~GILK01009365.1.p1  ORF type:complete len:632 (+),score=80.64 GILK01009365.1:68-1897(+)
MAAAGQRCVGVAGTTNFTTSVPEDADLTEVTIRSGLWVDGIQLLHTNKQGQRSISKFGGSGGLPRVMTFYPNEYLTCVMGSFCQDHIESLILVSNLRTFPPCGFASPQGQEFTWQAPDGEAIVGFHGSFTAYLNSLGPILRPLQPRHLLSSLSSVSESSIRVLNFEHEEVLSYCLPLISGLVPDHTRTVYISSTGDTKTREWPVYNGQFKGVVQLQLGENVVSIRAGADTLQLSLYYLPAKTVALSSTSSASRYFIRLVFLLSRDGNGCICGPEDECCSIESGRSRLAFCALLIQSVMAETMRSQGYGRLTFRLENEGDVGFPLVHQLRSPLTTSELHRMAGGDLWSHFYHELTQCGFANEQVINIGLMSFSSFDVHKKQPLGHTALGGGSLALFSCCNMYTWPSSIDELVHRITDDRPVDSNRFFDDSNHRGRRWSNFSTGVGAVLHELSHCLGLPHVTNGFGIMARDFDYLVRNFTSCEYITDQGRRIGMQVGLADEMRWHRGNAVRLYCSPFLRDIERPSHPKPVVTVIGNRIIVRGHSILYVGFHTSGSDLHSFVEYPLGTGPAQTEFNRDTLVATFKRELNESKLIRIIALDDEGQEVQFELHI